MELIKEIQLDRKEVEKPLPNILKKRDSRLSPSNSSQQTSCACRILLVPLSLWKISINKFVKKIAFALGSKAIQY
ncbi:hypothetical protein ABGT24_04490 [Peribacillus frigoritolerans]|uniref:hypothetical protein n=1 Tax=Peribacillus frigoritolerans TaxID=450367 RepID=UPI00345C67F9